jgi:uncharacterized membrane protein
VYRKALFHRIFFGKGVFRITRASQPVTFEGFLMSYMLAIVIGAVAGLRAMTAPAMISIAAASGWLDLSGSYLSFLSSKWAVFVLLLLAVVEMITDQLPTTPSRKVPQQFGARIFTGALSGAALGMPYGYWMAGLVSGVIGAVLGTYGGAAARAKLAEYFGKDMPAAFIEDAVAVLAAILVILLLPAVPGVVPTPS